MTTTPAAISQLLLRAGVVSGTGLAVACTRAGGGGTAIALDVSLVGLALACAVLPDSHLGLLLVGAVGVHWVATVDDPASPWAIGVAVALAIVHTSMAAASVAPIGAAWTSAMARRWGLRFMVVAAASIPTWAVTTAIEQADLDRSPALVSAALLVLAAAILWVRRRSLGLDLDPSAGSGQGTVRET